MKNNAKEAKRQALIQAGIPGSAIGHRKGSKIHQDKRKAAKNGQSKYKNNFANQIDD
jgi:hypothetical protein